MPAEDCRQQCDDDGTTARLYERGKSPDHLVGTSHWVLRLFISRRGLGSVFLRSVFEVRDDRGRHLHLVLVLVGLLYQLSLVLGKATVLAFIRLFSGNTTHTGRALSRQCVPLFDELQMHACKAWQGISTLPLPTV